MTSKSVFAWMKWTKRHWIMQKTIIERERVYWGIDFLYSNLLRRWTVVKQLFYSRFSYCYGKPIFFLFHQSFSLWYFSIQNFEMCKIRKFLSLLDNLKRFSMLFFRQSFHQFLRISMNWFISEKIELQTEHKCKCTIYWGN